MTNSNKTWRNQRSRKKSTSNNNKSNRKASDLDPRLLIKEASESTIKPYQSSKRIADLPIDQIIIERLIKKGYQQPTEIQEKTIQPLLEKKNILGIAQTGTGKTGAFLIPVLQQLLTNGKKKSYALVIVPTRELALQVSEEFKTMTQGLGLYSACFIGGTNINGNIRQLRNESHLVVATPGRLLDLTERKAIDLRKFNVLILDEFDRMLDMGFSRDVDRIINLMPNRKQTMLFSATLNKNQKNLIDQILNKYVSVKITSGESTTDQVKQEIVKVKSNEHRFETLIQLLKEGGFKRVIVFNETKHQVNKLCAKLNKVGIMAAQIQGNKSQNARQKALNDFKSGRARVLVATDVAGRGIDVSDVSHVINYQLPHTYDSYIHRIGRTGRAGKRGTALTFVNADNSYLN